MAIRACRYCGGLYATRPLEKFAGTPCECSKRDYTWKKFKIGQKVKILERNANVVEDFTGMIGEITDIDNYLEEYTVTFDDGKYWHYAAYQLKVQGA